MEIPPEELYRLLCNFHITATKKYNSKYATDTMFSFSRSIQRFLDENNAKVNILKDEKFKVSGEVPKCKRRELRNQGKGNKPNATVALKNEDIERIFCRKPVWCPWAWSTCAYDVVSTNSSIRRTLQQPRHESIQIKFGDIAWKKDECGGCKQNLVLSEASNSNIALGISAQKRRRLVIESSDEED